MKVSRKKPPALTPGYVGYVRVSDADVQSPERSHGYQTRLVKDIVVSPSGLPLIEIYADIASGRIASRTAYQRLLKDARAGKFSHVAIAFVDRFSRDNVEGIRVFEELTSLGIRVRIATCLSAEYESPDGAFLIGVLLGVARLESARTGQRTKEGMLEKLNGGGWGWLAPDGYRNTEVKKSELEPVERLKHAQYKHDVEVNPERLEMVKLAFELLLREDGKLTLDQIAEELHARGYRRASGTPWVAVKPNGKRVACAKQLSRLFHNWFYAGWVVVDNAWAKIPPKTVRGNWLPIVTTEAFERGLRILAERNDDRQHTPKHFYLLQRLVFLEHADGKLIRLNCQTPNAGREGGGTPYYSIISSKFNYLCADIDAQLPPWLWNIQVDAQYLPQIRETYRAELDQFLGHADGSERKRLEKLLKQIDDAELRAARLYAEEKIAYATFDQLASEWRDKRTAINVTLEGMRQTNQAYIASLDEALSLIAKAGILFDKLERSGQRELLLHLVKKVVISVEGQILRIELRSPFRYLHELMTSGDLATPQQTARQGKHETSRSGSARSRMVSVCAPTGMRRRSQPHPLAGRLTYPRLAL